MSGKSREEWFRSFPDLPNGIPSHDTFGDVFSRPDPEQFQSCFVERTQAASLPPGAAAAMDGRTVRRSHGRGAGRWAIRLVSAWASVNTLTPGQVGTEEKSNGTTAIPRLPEMPELNGCIVAAAS